MVTQLPLASNWQLKQRDPAKPLADDFIAADGWLPATVPGTVHQDLMAAGRIPDPFYGRNELDVQWVGEADWLYRCDFEVAAAWLAEGAVDVCFDGLDTFATVFLNGVEVLSSDDMFLPQRVRIEKVLRPGTNGLHVLFESAHRRGREREQQHGRMRVWNGDTSRVYVRKAQYQYGWDWGPCLITAGIWQTARLEAYALRIADVHCPAVVSPDLKQAHLPVRLELQSAAGDRPPAGMHVELRLFGPSGERVDLAHLPVDDHILEHTFEVTLPLLWWPNGYGDQPRYRLEVELRRHADVLDRREVRLGLRRLRLVQEPLDGEPGTTFLFEVNNTPIFCGGANWIPADSFPPRVSAKRYRALLELAAQANMVMLRVWGGGIYESDAFYDLCDELGLLVWQDFMFGCGQYPATPEFQARVREEAEAVVRRLRHHPCVALWCGNNEDYQLAHSIGVYQPDFQGDFAATAFPARALYERVLPEVCATLDPTRPYWPGSPFGGPDANDPTLGDRHTWDVWHGPMADYHDYPRFAGRFVSEFGMQALPALETIESVTPAPERYPESRTVEHHNKAGEGSRRLAVYLSDNFRVPCDLPDAIYLTQLLQAEALAAAYRGWRRRWAGIGRYGTAGALVWQLDDCWPVTSWAIVDSALRPKPAYFVVRRELAPIVLGLARSRNGMDAWAVNGSLAEVPVELELRAWSLEGERLKSDRRAASLAPNRSSELGSFEPGRGTDAAVVVGARLLSADGSVLARAALWPEPFKYHRFPDPGITLERLPDERLHVRAVRPAKGVWLAAGDRVRWSDNLLDLLPEDEQRLHAPGLGSADVRLRWLH